MRPTLQRKIIDFLRPLPQFESENSRKALLITAGLNHVTPSIELNGSSDAKKILTSAERFAEKMR